MVFSKSMRFLSSSYAPFIDRSSGKSVGMYKISLHDPESGVPSVFNVMDNTANASLLEAISECSFGDQCTVEFDLQPKDRLFSLRVIALS